MLTLVSHAELPSQATLPVEFLAAINTILSALQTAPQELYSTAIDYLKFIDELITKASTNLIVDIIKALQGGLEQWLHGQDSRLNVDDYNNVVCLYSSRTLSSADIRMCLGNETLR